MLLYNFINAFKPSDLVPLLTLSFDHTSSKSSFMILFKLLRFPLNDSGYYTKYSSLSEVSQVWDRKKPLRRKRWSQE